ncbi:bifunctional serine/threonine-protein kinase/ABC transporter substrate-binding protein [Streptomyces sp. NPDC093094]|uniref:bifunctional serine/threonine-protein kinase/ABC transporter substrate-binding protein n=1 Tax=Streptomyces sp. NPDC093094 TaxID=3366026 RepID=UPI0037F64E7E
MERLLPSDPSHLGGNRLLGRLGAGGMGVVYLARTPAGELAALKVIQPEYADQPEFRARFAREVAAARGVDGPWVARVLAADADAPAPWLASAFVPGPSLAEAVAACGALAPQAVRILGTVLAQALHAVHGARLVHRDVKPGNVLLALDGPRLIDFGIARAMDERTALTATGLVVGSPGFLSPEQARGQQITPASDVFSLGCVLAYAATARPPFGLGDSGALLYRTVHDAPDLQGVADGPLRAFLERCLAKDPGARPSAAEAAAVLADGVTGSGTDWLPDAVVRMIADRAAGLLALPGVQATEAGTPYAAARPAAPGRRRVLSWAAGGALLAAGAGGGAWALLHDDAEPAGRRSRKRQWLLGVQADLSGPGTAVGREQERAARLAVAEHNARGDKPFELVLRVEDDGGDLERARAAARRLSGDRDMLAVFGPTGAATAPVVDLYEDAGLPLVAVSEQSIGAMSTALMRRPRHYFRAAPLNSYTAFGVVLALVRQRARHLGMIIDRAGRISGWEPAQMMHQPASLAELSVTHKVVPVSVADGTPAVRDLLGRGADSVYYSGTPERAADVARFLRARRFAGPRFLDPCSAGEAFLAAAGDAAEGWQAVVPYSDPAARAARTFAAVYRRRYRGGPGPWAVETYDAVRLVVDRLTALAGPGARRPSRDALTDALGAARYRGIAGTYSFNERRWLNAENVYLYQVRDGRFRYTGPLTVEGV